MTTTALYSRRVCASCAAVNEHKLIAEHPIAQYQCRNCNAIAQQHKPDEIEPPLAQQVDAAVERAQRATVANSDPGPALGWNGMKGDHVMSPRAAERLEAEAKVEAEMGEKIKLAPREQCDALSGYGVRCSYDAGHKTDHYFWHTPELIDQRLREEIAQLKARAERAELDLTREREERAQAIVGWRRANETAERNRDDANAAEHRLAELTALAPRALEIRDLHANRNRISEHACRCVVCSVANVLDRQAREAAQETPVPLSPGGEEHGGVDRVAPSGGDSAPRKGTAPEPPEGGRLTAKGVADHVRGYATHGDEGDVALVERFARQQTQKALRLHLAEATPDRWNWMSEDDNHLESMSDGMAVTIAAGTLRGLLAEREAEIAKLRGEVRSLQAHYDSLEQKNEAAAEYYRAGQRLRKAATAALDAWSVWNGWTTATSSGLMTERFATLGAAVNALAEALAAPAAEPAPDNRKVQESATKVAWAIIAGVRNDLRLGAVDSFDDTLAGRIADVIEGERQTARQAFDYYAIPAPPAQPAERTALTPDESRVLDALIADPPRAPEWLRKAVVERTAERLPTLADIFDRRDGHTFPALSQYEDRLACIEGWIAARDAAAGKGQGDG